MRAIAAGLLVTSCLLSAAPAAALVLCVKKSGVVVQRTECKRKEKPLDLGQFVIVGPKGDKGDKGDPAVGAIPCLSASGNDVFFTGCNVHIRSGSGRTDGEVNGLGNLIVGYDERGFCDNAGTLCSSDGDCPTGDACVAQGLCQPAARTHCFTNSDCTEDGDTCVRAVKTGSHNLVVGAPNMYSRYGGLVAGRKNAISGPFASVSGGEDNVAIGGGASVSGGFANIASGEVASVSGGYSNTASALYASVTGGDSNTASGDASSVTGGLGNVASGDGASITGGSANAATNYYATVSGGYLNTASADDSSWVGGGHLNTASGQYSSVCGGISNTASSFYSSVSGGEDNTASGSAGSVSGGRFNVASELAASVSGGIEITSDETYEWHAGQQSGFPSDSVY